LPAKATSAEQLGDMLPEYGTWMYRFDLGHGVQTALHSEYLDGMHQSRWAMIQPELERTFAGRWDRTRALDIACNEGWFAFEVAKLGAAETIGFDARDINIRKAHFVQAQLETPRLTFRTQNLFDVDARREGPFDLVLCLGLIYHLEDPMGAVRKLRSLTRELCVIETEVARPANITIDRGPGDGLLTTEDAFVFMPEPEYQWNPLSSVTGAAIVPTLSALKSMLTLVGFKEIAQAAPPDGSAERYSAGDRVVLFARL
jgi:tRNA (mo5U34)-methyltransferase